MKFAIIIPDGAADRPTEKLGGKTPLERAAMPNIKNIVSRGILGRVKTIPDGFHPGSDIGIMTLLGYEPSRYYTGRAPLEAAAMGIRLTADKIAFRCNLVTVDNGYMKDFSAGHIETDDARILMQYIDQSLGSKQTRFYAGISYRHIMITEGEDFDDTLKTVPPHDIMGKNIKEYLPQGRGADILIELMEKSYQLLKDHPINRKRKEKGKEPANMIWLWGEGKGVSLPAFNERFKTGAGAAISAVDLVRGICKLINWEIIEVPGITGYIDTNYEGKGKYAASALEKFDIITVHIEAPDEMGHEGDAEKKIDAMEKIDRFIVLPILEKLKEFKDWRILISPDHRTPVDLRTHSEEAVPFVIAGSDIGSNGFNEFTEAAAGRSNIYIEKGWELMERFTRPAILL